ncbi:DUF2156 domain-containing protein [Natranaerobius thermophilus]|uniref:Phosphatidylglycerol lysyltransferase C-terminal domain-containing protein n=1 Tax=Natranaerobius thermophilus (strain ATCC BAA-1301 / DSM 18059 / JW/NM-WN-LF) TaxID=457570 RepID=B2A4H2_NATTJ|nr:phosphatidylglycerol lysyltransferase domain-containing protein [Natranaerobius thermophilus]ACB85149.1 conserved hypothetical protein [Natranaerobius thermophilus JW/NM-WN-LF]
MRKPDLQVGKWSFHEVKLEDKELFNEFIKESNHPVNLWSANFPFIWLYSRSPRRKILWKIIDDMLVVFILTRNRKLSLLCLPFGNGSVDKLINVLNDALRYCAEWTKVRRYKTRVRTINKFQLDYLQTSNKFNKLFKLKELRGIEHHYSTEELLVLEGKKYQSLRKTVNKHYREYPNINFRKYQPEDYEKILRFNKNWEKTSGNKYRELIDKSYFKSVFEYNEQLDMEILVAELNDEIVGVNAGALLPTGDAWGCICKTNAEIVGLNEAIILEYIKELIKIDNSVQYLNVGSDMGISGLRNYKRKFRPAFSIERYRIFHKFMI